jgi:hypothetical protein
LQIRALQRSVSPGATGGCSEAENLHTANVLGWLGLLAGIVALGVPPLLARATRPIIRAAAAVPLALAVGALLYVLGVPAAARWGENLTLFAMAGAATALLVPPTVRAHAGLLVGAVVASSFGDVPFPSLLVAGCAVVVGYASHRDRPPTHPPGHSAR